MSCTWFLAFYTRLLHWRRGHGALVKGGMELLPEHAQVLAFVREHAGAKVLCVFNFSPDAVQWDLPQGLSARPLADSPLQGGTLVAAQVALQAWGGLFASL